MTDSRLRDLERRYQTTGAKDDEQAYDIARVRAGEAIETGFLQRVEVLRDSFPTRLRVYLPGGSRDVSVDPLIRGHSLRDIEYADGGVFLLGERNYGVHSAEGGYQRRDTWRVLRISAEGGVEIEPAVPYQGQGLLNVNGRLGRIAMSYVEGWHVRFSETDAMGFSRKGFGLHRLFEYTEKTGFLRLVQGDAQAFEFHAETGEGYTSCPRTFDAARRVGLYVQDGEVCDAVDTVTWKSNAARLRSEFQGIPLPPNSRLRTGRFVAPKSGLAGFYGLRPTYPGGVCEFRVIREVPRKNLEGLLIAVERASHKRVKK